GPRGLGRGDGALGRDGRLVVPRPGDAPARGLPLRDPVPGRIDRLVGPGHARLRAGLQGAPAGDRDDRRRLVPTDGAGGLDDDPARAPAWPPPPSQPTPPPPL